jgi:ubiquinone/menaquinone biosynthesis C-methylase UbiE
MNDAGRMFSDGKAYERMMGRWSRAVGEQFLGWLNVTKGQRWLDVGCGNGAFTELLIARMSPTEVMAIDPSDGQIAYARTRAGVSTAQFRIGDAQELPYADGHFDAAAMALVISFVPNPAKAVAEMARVVRPGGLVAAYMWDFDGGVPLQPFTAAMKAMGLPVNLPPSSAVATLDNMRTLWEQAGLVGIDTTVIRIKVGFDDFEDFWTSNAVPIGPQGKAISEMSPAKRDELRARLREALPVGKDGRIAYEAFANAVKGKKK